MGAYRTLTLAGGVYLLVRMAVDRYLEMRPPLRFEPQRRLVRDHPFFTQDRLVDFERWSRIRSALEHEAGWYDPVFMRKWRRRHVLVVLRIRRRDLVYRDPVA